MSKILARDEYDVLIGPIEDNGACWRELFHLLDHWTYPTFTSYSLFLAKGFAGFLKPLLNAPSKDVLAFETCLGLPRTEYLIKLRSR